jgi:hypothetical protein
MAASDWHIDTAPTPDDEDEAWRRSREDLVDRIGTWTAWFMLCLALFIAGLWLSNRPSFEKCSALGSATARTACYDQLRNELLKPPAKGGVFPTDRDTVQ